MLKNNPKIIKRSRLLEWIEARRLNYSNRRSESSDAEEVRYYTDLITELDEIHRVVKKGLIN